MCGATRSDGTEQRRPLLAGVVGESGGGKTLVLHMFGALGAATIEADAVAREVVAPGSPVLQAIADAFGAEFIRPDGSLDRQALGRRVFTDEEARQRLNALTHPAILARIKARIEELSSRSRPPGVIALEAAVLQEMGALELVDVLVRVGAPRAVRVERIRRRDNLTVADAEARLAAQEQAGLGQLDADYDIDNGSDIEATRQQVRAVWRRLVESRARGGIGSSRGCAEA